MSMSTSDFNIFSVIRANALTIARYGVGFLIALWVVLPLLYSFSVSFRPPDEFFGAPHLIPHNPTLQAWERSYGTMSQPLVYSATIAVGTAILSLIITITGAYAFGRKEFYGKRAAFYVIILSLLFPYVLLVIPLADMWQTFGIYNTIPGLWLAYQAFVTPFALWILRDFFESLPTNLEESAMIYGCSEFTAFLRVVLPISAPALAAVAFLSFRAGWNDFLVSNMLTSGGGPQPATVVLFNTVAGTERKFWAEIMAQVFIIGIPPTIVYLTARRYLQEAFSV